MTFWEDIINQNYNCKKGVPKPLCILSHIWDSRVPLPPFINNSILIKWASTWPAQACAVTGDVDNLQKNVDVPILVHLLLFKVSSIEVNLNIIKITNLKFAIKCVLTNVHSYGTIITMIENVSVNPHNSLMPIPYLQVLETLISHTID